MLLVSLDFPFLIVPSVFSNVYLEQSKTEKAPSGFSNVYLEQSKTENVPSGFSNVY
jgi:hypothetical protein